MKLTRFRLTTLALSLVFAGLPGLGLAADADHATSRHPQALEQITNLVVIYAENRSFDNLYGGFPGANGYLRDKGHHVKQLDRDGKTVLPVLPPAWNGLTAPGQTPVVTQAQTTNVWPNAPFRIDEATDRFGYGVLPESIVTRDLYHRFFENAMQIDGGRNDMYVAWADSGGLVMGTFDGSRSKLWELAKRYTLADNFFQAAYGGSFLNHQYLVCACAPTVPAATVAANRMSINVLGPSIGGVPQLASNTSQTPSALDGPTSFKTGNIAPLDYFGSGDGYRAVNTMQPAYQPSGNKPVDNIGSDGLYANPAAATALPPQTQTTIGDLLSARGIDWAWYAGGWNAAVANPYPYNSTTGTFGTSTTIYDANGFGTSDAAHGDFQAHHQPFNYYAAFDPVAHADARRAHLKDRSDLLYEAQAGTLPPVAFYKPIGFTNQHPGYANVTDGDDEIASVVAALQASRQWPHMLIVITYDEFGGQFDHVAPPNGDLIGPGTRIPALLISPWVKSGHVDHTPYDTASILRFISTRWSVPRLPGLVQRDQALMTNGSRPMGDLTSALRD
jgi:acid phosphatase